MSKKNITTATSTKTSVATTITSKSTYEWSIPKKSQPPRIPILEAPNAETVNESIDRYNQIIKKTRQFTGIEYLLETVIRLPQYELKDFLYSVLVGFGYDVVYADGYLFAKGDVPVMLCAHMDTVHKESVKEIFVSEQGKLWSPQGIGGDDRCGIFTILRNLRTDIKPYILFTENEEVGCIGAGYFVDDLEGGIIDRNSIDINFIIEIDRKGSDDSVYYDCDNFEFENFISTFGFKTSWGSCSDISYVAPALGVAAVNLSSGYYNAHTLDEYIVLSELYDTASRVSCIISEAANGNTVKYEYVEKIIGKYGGKWNKYYDDYDDWKDEFDYGRKYGKTIEAENEEAQAAETEDYDFDEMTLDEMTLIEDGAYLIDTQGYMFEPDCEYYINSKGHVFEIVDSTCEEYFYYTSIVKQIDACAYTEGGTPYKYDPNNTELVYIIKEDWSCTK